MVENRDGDLVEPEGVNAGGPVTGSDPAVPPGAQVTPTGAEVTPTGAEGAPPRAPGPEGASGHGEMLSRGEPERPPQPGQELSAGEG